MLKKFTLTMFLIIWTVISVSAAKGQTTTTEAKPPEALAKGDSQNCISKIPKDLKVEEYEYSDIYIQDGVDMAVCLKNQNTSDSDIMDILHQYRRYRFGWAQLDQSQIKQLKDGKFSDDFIKNYVGVPQYVTVGAAAIYLFSSNTAVGAAIVRIQVTPRSYYAPLNTFPWSKIPQRKRDTKKEKPWYYNFIPGESNAWINRFDLNLGVTSASSPDSNSNTQSNPFILAGISYELHKAALLNFGYAFSTAGTNNKTGQLYLGVTLDSNILKTVGLIK